MSVPSHEAGEAKKRKRTGKQREERKLAAIQANFEAGRSTDNRVDTRDEDADVTEPIQIAPAPLHPTVDLERAANRIPQALKSLHPVFKHAKVIETRRLIKKIKLLRTKPDQAAEIVDLETQLQLLSHLTVHPIIESHILLKLRKHPSVKHLHLPDFIITLLGPSFEPTAPSSMTMTFALIDKVENRLCSSKAVAEAVRATIAWVMGEEGAKLGIRQMGKGNKADSGMSGSSRGARKASGTKLNDQEALEEAEEEDEDEDVESEGSQGARRNILGNRNADDEVSEADEAADAAGWGSGSILGDEDDEESGHRDGLPSASSDEDEPAIPLSVSKRPKPRPPSRTRSKPLPKSSTGLITSSTFLPTLSTGFTLGDSDSDPDLDRDPDGIVGTQKAERKNRRGQRARQAIWEKKFGKNAKHVIKAKEEERNGPVGNGWGLSRGPRGGAQGVEQAGGREMAPVPIGNGFAPRSAASTARQPPPPDTSKKGLHPSWEAARIKRAREGAAAPKATKIVFD